MESLTTLVIWIAFGIISYAIAEKKGRNKTIALAFGLLFGIFTLAYYIIAPGSREYEESKSLTNTK